MGNFLDPLIGRSQLIRENGVDQPSRTALNFSTGINVSDDPTNNQTTVSVASGLGNAVSTISALRALNSGDTPISLRGHSVIGDGGGGTFDFDSGDSTTVDDGGTVIVDAGGRRYKRRNTDYISALWFGLKADCISVTGVSTTATSGAVTVSSGAFTNSDIGKAILINIPPPGSIGTGTITPANSVTNDADGNPLGYLLTGSGTLFTTEFSLGQAIYINGKFHNVSAITSDTVAYVFQQPNTTSAGTAFYLKAMWAATISAVGSTTSITVNANATITKSGLVGVYGTDNAAALDAARTAAIKAQRFLEIPAGQSSYGIFSQINPLTRGERIRGSRWTMRDAGYCGDPVWTIETSTTSTTEMSGTVLRFFKGDGFLCSNGGNATISGVVMHDLVLLGGSVGTALGNNSASLNIVDWDVRNVHLINWAVGLSPYNSFGQTSIDLLRCEGCAIGIDAHLNDLTTYKDLNIEHCGVGMWIRFAGESRIDTGVAQGCNVTGLYLGSRPGDGGGPTGWEISGFHFEGNFRGSMIIDATTYAVQHVSFRKCASNDTYTLNPLVVGGPVSDFTTDGCGFNTITVKPKFLYWHDSSSWAAIDWSGPGIVGVGGAGGADILNPYRIDYPGNLFTVPVVSNVATPDVANGSIQYITYSNNLTVAAPKVSGTTNTPPPWFRLKLILVPSANSKTVTFDGVYLNNPWTDTATGSGKVASVEYIHLGGGNWTCIGHTPFAGSWQTVGGDISGTIPNMTVTTLTGSGGLLPIIAGQLHWTSTVTPILNQDSLGTANATGHAFILAAQDSSGTGTCTGGSLFLQAGSGSDSAHGGNVYMYAGNGINLQFQINPTGIGFYGTSPVAQASRAGQISDTTGGTSTGALVDVTTGGLADPSKVNDDIARLAAKVNALELIIHNLGLSA